MKRKYLNSEKVSDNYLFKRYQKVKTKFGEFKDRKMFFAVAKFNSQLNEIYENTELDNYKKLRKIIELEHEFNKYLKTKEFLLDLIYDYIQNDSDAFGLRSSNCQVNGPFIFAFLSGNPNYEVYEYLPSKTKITLAEFIKCHYYGEFFAIDYAQLIKQLTDKDIADLKKLLAKKYRDIFLAGDFERFVITYSSVFSEAEGDKVVAFIAKQFMSAYWETFDYPEDPELAQNFKQEVMENIKEPKRFLKLAKNPDFWYVLMNFRAYYEFSLTFDPLNDVSAIFSEFQNSEIPVEEKKFKEKYKLSDSEAIQKLKGMSNARPLSFVLANLDFSGISLLDYSITAPGSTLVNVNFENTGITIDLSKINQISDLCYLKGERIDFKDLTSSCFKGCRINGASFDVLNSFAFSINTFDVDVLKEAGFYCEGVSEDLLDKFYRKEVISMNEFNMFADKFDIEKVKMHYSNLKIGNSALEWLMIKEKVFG